MTGSFKLETRVICRSLHTALRLGWVSASVHQDLGVACALLSMRRCAVVHAILSLKHHAVIVRLISTAR